MLKVIASANGIVGLKAAMEVLKKAGLRSTRLRKACDTLNQIQRITPSGTAGCRTFWARLSSMPHNGREDPGGGYSGRR